MIKKWKGRAEFFFCPRWYEKLNLKLKNKTYDLSFDHSLFSKSWSIYFSQNTPYGIDAPFEYKEAYGFALVGRSVCSSCVFWLHAWYSVVVPKTIVSTDCQVT